MRVIPRGELRKHLNKNGKWWLLWMKVDEANVLNHETHAAKHHEDENAEQLRLRALFRIACRKRFPWMKVIAVLGLAIAIALEVSR